MVKDKSANERYEYNQKILQTEQVLEDLRTQERQLQNALENLESTAIREFSRLQEMDDELMKRGSHSAQWDFEENRGKAQFIKNFVMNQSDELTQVFSKEAQGVEDRREQLQQERDKLPWD